MKEIPIRNRPWANLGVGGDENSFYAAYISDNGLGVTLVRMTSNNSVVLEDIVENKIVLFVTNQNVKMPVQVELYDDSRKLVNSHRALPEVGLP